MRITCPCGEYIKIKIINGVITYMHEGGGPCKELNSININNCQTFVWDICEKAIENKDHETFNTYMCKVSPFILMKLVERVRYYTKSELIEFFKFVFAEGNVSIDTMAAITTELVKEFGFNARANIEAAVKSTNLSKIMLNIAENRPSRKYAASTMLNISNELRITNNSTKKNIIKDLTRSFEIERSIRQTEIAKAIRSKL